MGGFCMGLTQGLGGNQRLKCKKQKAKGKIFSAKIRQGFY
jgi:hypothetical protein